MLVGSVKALLMAGYLLALYLWVFINHNTIDIVDISVLSIQDPGLEWIASVVRNPKLIKFLTSYGGRANLSPTPYTTPPSSPKGRGTIFVL
jgi:hypothetical protein